MVAGLRAAAGERRLQRPLDLPLALVQVSVHVEGTGRGYFLRLHPSPYNNNSAIWTAFNAAPFSN